MQIDHDQSANRFVARLDSGEAELAYIERGERILDLVHTQVPPAARGEGVGDQLVARAVEFAEANDLRIVPSCPFVRQWMSEHPEHSDVLAPGSG